MSKKTRHVAFLVRWQDEGEQTRWQATVENAYTGERVRFARKRDLLRFLWHVLYGGRAAGTDADADARDLQRQ